MNREKHAKSVKSPPLQTELAPYTSTRKRHYTMTLIQVFFYDQSFDTAIRENGAGVEGYSLYNVNLNTLIRVDVSFNGGIGYT